MDSVAKPNPQTSEDAELTYDITRSQAFGPNRRFVQSEIHNILNDLRQAYRFSSRSEHALINIRKAANRLKAIYSRFENDYPNMGQGRQR